MSPFFEIAWPIIGITGLILVVTVISTYGLYLLVHQDIEKGALRLLNLVQAENAHVLWLVSSYLERKTELTLAEMHSGAPLSHDKRKVLEARVHELQAQIDEHIRHVQKHLEDYHRKTGQSHYMLSAAKTIASNAKATAPTVDQIKDKGKPERTTLADTPVDSFSEDRL